MQRLCMLILCAMPLMAAHAAVPIVTDSRIKTFIYNANEVFAVTTHYGYQANVEFGEKEEIETVSVGDRVGWQIVPAGRRLFIRAMEENAHTNMTIVTNLRAYQFDLRSSNSDAVYGSEELTYVMRFYYPEDGDKSPVPAIYTNQMIGSGGVYGGAGYTSGYATQQAVPVVPIQSSALPPQSPYPPQPYAPQPYANNYAPPAPSYAPPSRYDTAPSYSPAPSYGSYGAATVTPPAPVSSAPLPPPTQTASISPLQPIATPGASSSPPPASTGSSINYRYTYSGPSEIAPVKIYDDGKSTYFKFRDASKLPRFSVITERGEEIVVQHSVNADGIAIIDRLAPRFSLEQNGAKVIVYNEAQG